MSKRQSTIAAVVMVLLAWGGCSAWVANSDEPTRYGDKVYEETGMSMTEAWCSDIRKGNPPLGMMMGAVRRGTYRDGAAAALDAQAMTRNGCADQFDTNEELQVYLESWDLEAA